MRVVSWNLNVRRDCAGQVAALRAMRADVVALQEVTARSWANLSPLLAEAGYVQQLTGVGQLPITMPPRLDRFVAVASRWDLVPAAPLPVPAPENVLTATICSREGEVDVIAIYIPNATREPPLKVEMQEGIVARVAALAQGRLILCGDFNSPRAESESGEILPFSLKSHVRERAAEVALVEGIRTYGMRDAFRCVNGYGPRDQSWCITQRGVPYGFRLDHVFVSESLTPEACWYAHELREARLSDHSPILVDVRV